PPVADAPGSDRRTGTAWTSFCCSGRSLMSVKRSVACWVGIAVAVLAPALLAGRGAQPPGGQEQQGAVAVGSEALPLPAGQPTPEQQQELAEAARLNKEAYGLYAKGQYAAAEKLMRQVLDTFLKVRGEQHPDTAHAYNNLAETLRAQAQYAQAEQLHRKALD